MKPEAAGKADGFRWLDVPYEQHIRYVTFIFFICKVKYIYSCLAHILKSATQLLISVMKSIVKYYSPHDDIPENDVDSGLEQFDQDELGLMRGALRFG